MTNKKNTKKALTASVMSVVLCVVMLIGTTFAWFTDSVTSSGNKIVAGNLDVELEYAIPEKGASLTALSDKDWKSVDDVDSLFDKDVLWEPGHAQVVYLRIRNAGSLALKYKFALDIEEEVYGYNKDNERFYLHDYLQYGVVDSNLTNAFKDRTEAIAAVTEPSPLKEFSKEGELEANSQPKYLAMVVYMPDTVGNKANAGRRPASIKLALKLLATQNTVEEDSFGPDYDKDTTLNFKHVTDRSDLTLVDGTTYILENDIIPDKISQVSVFYINKYNTTLSIGSHTVKAPTYANRDMGAISVGSSSNKEVGLNIVSNGVVDGGSGSRTNMAVKANGAKTTVNIMSGTYTTGACADGAGSSVIFANGGATINIYDGYFYTDVPYNGKYWVLNCQDGTNSKINVYGGTFVNFNPADNDSEGPHTNFVAEGYEVKIDNTNPDKILYTVVKSKA